MKRYRVVDAGAIHTGICVESEHACLATGQRKRRLDIMALADQANAAVELAHLVKQVIPLVDYLRGLALHLEAPGGKMDRDDLEVLAGAMREAIK